MHLRLLIEVWRLQIRPSREPRLVHYWIGEGFVAADGESKGANGSSSVVLLLGCEHGPRERDWTLGVVS